MDKQNNHRRTGRRAGVNFHPPPPSKFGGDKIRSNSSGRTVENKFLSVIKTEKFSKIGNDKQEFGY